MNKGLTPVAPVRPIAPWLGGKRNLAKRLVALIDTTQHDIYAEPFVGMGGVFLRRTRCPRAELINDRQRDVYTVGQIRRNAALWGCSEAS
jgi:DNA adenine methylase